jgi:hypothetical protein
VADRRGPSGQVPPQRWPCSHFRSQFAADPLSRSRRF